VIPEVRFFFDECLSRPVVEGDLVRSLALYGSTVEVAHLLTKFGSSGVKDIEWIPALARETGWIVITADQGRNSKKSEKLPLICRAFGVTHVMLSRALHRRNMFHKALAISTLWEKLHQLGDKPRGAGYRINMAGEGFRLVGVTDAPAEAEIFDPSTELHQQELFGN
jgi:hypothetical protein